MNRNWLVGLVMGLAVGLFSIWILGALWGLLSCGLILFVLLNCNKEDAHAFMTGAFLAAIVMSWAGPVASKTVAIMAFAYVVVSLGILARMIKEGKSR